MNPKKIAEIFLPIMLALLLLPNMVFAEPEPQPIIEIDLQGVIDSVNNMFSGLSDSISGIPQAVLDSFTGFLKAEMVSFVDPLFAVMKALMLYNIDPFNYESYWFTIVSIISAFYLLLFVVVGLRFLLGCYDASHRAKAKEWFKNAIIIVIAVNASLLLYSLLLMLGSGIAQTLWNPELEQLLTIDLLDTLNFIWLGILALFVFLAMITLIVRQIFLIIAVMIFPIGIFLYFIPPLKAYGSALLHLTAIFVFMQVADVIILIGVKLFSTEFSGLPFINLISLSSGFLFIFMANLWLMGFAVTKALHEVGVKIDVVQTVKTVGTTVAALV